jgi:cytochrome c
MLKTFLILFIPVAGIFLFDAVNFSFPPKSVAPQQNTPPVVKIISPKNNTSFSAGSDVHYSITVSDKEDGESQFDEINTKEVLLQVKYFSDTSTLAKTNEKTVENDPPGLQAMRTSNCLNCHGFENKVIGPSFTEIKKKYPFTTANIALLSKRIREGSTGIWGKVSMPTHPELTSEQINNMANWILQNSSKEGTHYYVGINGFFKLGAENKSGSYLLTATYTDHGINNSGPRLKGQDKIIIRVK